MLEAIIIIIVIKNEIQDYKSEESTIQSKFPAWEYLF